MPKTALLILADGFEEIEAITPIDLLRRAGAAVTVASLDTATPGVKGRSGITVLSDSPFESARHKQYDAIVLPGGPGHIHLRRNTALHKLLRQHAARGALVAAICAAPTVLLDAGLLNGKKYTAHPSVALELPALISSRAVVQDGNILTSPGAGAAVAFSLAIITQLYGPEKSREIAQSICTGEG